MAKFLSLLKEINGKVRMHDRKSDIVAYGESVS
jgi:hypothetical protein